MATHSAAGNHENADLALAVYLEEVCDGRTVLWIGDDGERAVDRLGRVARQVRVSRRVPTLDEGSVDVVVVPDIEAAGLAAPEAIAELARALGPDGALIAGASVEGPIDYEGLFALTSPEFASVRMLGQSRFRGFAVVDFDADPEEQERPTLDGSLVDTDEAERFVALCAGTAARLDAYAVIRVPGPEPRRRRRRRGSAPPPARDEADRTRLSEVEEELRAAHEHAEGIELDLASRTTELEEVRNRLEGAGADHERALSAIEARLDDEKKRVRELEERVSEAATRKAPRKASRKAPPTSNGYDPAKEYTKIETLLEGRGRALADAERELSRRAVLVRDIVEELREAQSAGASGTGAVAVVQSAPQSVAAPPSDDALAAERDRAVTRALEAEAARAETQFAVDELMGELAVSTERIEALMAREAELSGRVRGLEARWAESDELEGLTAARQVLTEHDLAAARARIRELEGNLGETRDQLEFEMLKARGPAPKPETTGVRPAVRDADEETAALRASESRLSERVSELSLQLTAAEDLASSAGDAELREQLGAARQLVGTLTEERDHSRAENIRLTMMVGSLEDRFAGARRGYELRIAEIQHDLSMARDTDPGPVADTPRIEALEGELAGLRARLSDREAALAALRSAPATVDVSAQDDADRLRVQVVGLKDSETDLTVRLADAEELSELEANRANDMASTVAARDALVNRLQLDLANEERRARESEEASDRFREEAERLRDAVVGASERVGEIDDLASKVSELEAALKDATIVGETHGGRMEAAEEILREARAVLGELAAGLAEDGVVFGQTAMGIEAPDTAWNEPASAAPKGADGEAARLAARLEAMEREAADKETLLRSMTAQLEERDERLRGLDDQRGADDMRRNLLELQERAAKLSESLAHEKRARRDAEAAAQGKRSEELTKLHETLGDRDAELLVLRGQVSSGERDLKAFREAAAETRSGLEELLGKATAQGDPATAERVGGLLRVLSRVT